MLRYRDISQIVCRDYQIKEIESDLYPLSSLIIKRTYGLQLSWSNYISLSRTRSAAFIYQTDDRLLMSMRSDDVWVTYAWRNNDS